MIKKSLVFCFLFLLSNTFCSECTDKTSLSDGEDKYACYNLRTSSSEKICRYDETKNGCVEKTCSDFAVDECDKMSPVPDQESSNQKMCFPKADNSGCEFVFCEDLKSNCDKFYAVYNGEKCALNSEKTHCEIKRCSDLTSNCE